MLNKKVLFVSSVVLSSIAVYTSNTISISAQAADIHVISQGDQLETIANQYGVTIDELMSWNELSGIEELSAGETLFVTDPLAEEVLQEEENILESTESSEELINGEVSTEESSLNTEVETEVLETHETITITQNIFTSEMNSHYVVKHGDSLWAIANANGITVAQLKEWNGLSSNYIYTGDRLVVSNPNVTAPETPQPDEPTPPEEEPENPAPTNYYTVKQGDSLWAIANANGITVAQLKEWNGLSSNYIYTGDRLVVSNPNVTVPETPQPDEPTPPEEEPENPAPTNYYTVKHGDSLWAIANANGITVAQLKEWNGLSSNYIYTGDRLVVSNPNVTVPETPQPDEPTPPEEEPENPAPTNYYTVKHGDSLWAIANANGITVAQLKEWNGLSSNYIYSGDQLIVSKTTNTPTDPIPVTSRSVYIDAGHGGSETGASFYGVHEKNLNLKIATQVADKLRAQGYSVFETRRDDRTVDLHQRDDLPNELKTDIFVSIHHNAMPAHLQGSARGILTLYHDRSIDEPGYNTLPHHTDQMLAEGKRLAQLLQQGMVESSGGIDLGARPQNLHVTRTTDMPAALVELGFMDNWSDFKNITDSVYQAKMVDGLVRGINRYFGV
ncbi:LysM peptidoglycan-binding domain-containing protein [Facklamia sp. DSM 111018]|uniref:LysM peptidoglycan-binding domain-containing protein n=1 Tax=Facklamia lactis TaxID=2749967 RepID=A0ABS0LTD2_9LACT|nr:LysM peptidoglycan-binding domain-containing protein [Facklamia lactis]MBG9980725.1 LysM peptidoglycan-binding domain-containing protein [Facklamia lactis]MBG9986539.1 LysM peptidoglycan-binding domain-containing protein [Facklamia lactis]